MVNREYHSWVDTDTATNATATATKAAPAEGLSHFITSVSGSFDATASGITLILKDGSTEVARWNVYDSFALALSSPIKLSPGTAANLELAAGGAGIVGAATLTGYTL